jgi:hypothetical protein
MSCPTGGTRTGSRGASRGRICGRRWVQLAAVSEDQTKNSWTPLLEMLRDGPVVDNYPGPRGVRLVREPAEGPYRVRDELGDVS